MLSMKDNTFLTGAILAAALIIAGSLVYVFGPERVAVAPDSNLAAIEQSIITLPPFEAVLPYRQTSITGGDVLLGNPDAPVEIVEYSDYQCPFCIRFTMQTESQIREDYIASGKAKIIYKDLIVVDSFVSAGHESADAALAANCAADQGKFWEYHDALFTIESIDDKENNGNLTKELFWAISDKLEMDRSAFESCFDSGKYLDKIASGIEEARNDLERLSTPSFLINGQLVQGAVPYEQFTAIIEGFLK